MLQQGFFAWLVITPKSVQNDTRKSSLVFQGNRCSLQASGRNPLPACTQAAERIGEDQLLQRHQELANVGSKMPLPTHRLIQDGKSHAQVTRLFPNEQWEEKAHQAAKYKSSPVTGLPTHPPTLLRAGAGGLLE